ncbi:MAG: CBS domain-containing protein [Promethearchaeota archaeon]
MPILPDLKDIKRIRRKLDLTQKDLERDLGIPQATLSRIESGKGNPNYNTIKKIFDYLELKKFSKKRIAAEIMTKDIIYVSSDSPIKSVVNLMNQNNLSQLPIIERNQNIGSITAKRIQKEITDNPELINFEIELIKELPFPEIEKNWDLTDISNLLINYPAVLVRDGNNIIGIITDADLLRTT